MNPNLSLKLHVVLLILMGGLSMAGCINRQYQPAEWKPAEPNQAKTTDEQVTIDDERLKNFGQLTDWTADNQVAPKQKIRNDAGSAKQRPSDGSTLPRRNLNPATSSTLPNRGNVNSTLPARNPSASTLPMRDASPRVDNKGQTLPMRNNQPKSPVPGRSPSATTLPQSGK